MHRRALRVYARAVAEEQSAALKEAARFSDQRRLGDHVKQLHAEGARGGIVDFDVQQAVGMHHDKIEVVIKPFLGKRPSASEEERRSSCC
jgi:hypothetical protein